MDPSPESPSIDLFDASLADRLSVFPIQARQAMLGSVSGRHKSPHRGSSVEFAEYRRYQPGDDPRRLDWRAYARSDRYYVKEFEADTNLRLMLVIDCSGSMGFGAKFDRARQIAATLAYLAIQQGDAAGLVASGEHQDVAIPPRRNATQVSVLFDSLRQIRTDGQTCLTDSLHEIAETIRTRALVVVISDLFFDSDPLRSAIDHLRFRRHDVAVFHLMDRQEVAPDWKGRVRIDDLEGDDPILIEPDEIIEAYETEVRKFLDTTEALFRETATDYQLAFSDQSVEEVLTKFLSDRASAGNTR